MAKLGTLTELVLNKDKFLSITAHKSSNFKHLYYVLIFLLICMSRERFWGQSLHGRIFAINMQTF